MIVNAGVYVVSIQKTKVIQKNLIKIAKQQTFQPIEPLGVAP